VQGFAEGTGHGRAEEVVAVASSLGSLHLPLWKQVALEICGSLVLPDAASFLASWVPLGAFVAEASAMGLVAAGFLVPVASVLKGH